MGKPAAVDRQEKEKHKTADDQAQRFPDGWTSRSGWVPPALGCLQGH
jgi:hypothetical protein